METEKEQIQVDTTANGPSSISISKDQEQQNRLINENKLLLKNKFNEIR